MSKAVRYIGCFFLTLTILAGLLLAVCTIPQSAIEPQMQESAKQLSETEVYHYYVDQGEYSVQDNYAESILMGIIWDVDAAHPLNAMIRDSFYSNSAYANEDLLTAVDEQQAGNLEYSRYWHGSMILLRPLLTIFNLAQIRIALAVLLGVLIFAVAVLLIRRSCLDVLIIYMIGLISINIWFVPLCMEYISNFLIMNVMILFFLLAGEHQERFYYLSIIAGVATAFCDFLTTETITLMVPLVIVTLVRGKKGLLGDWKRELVSMLKLGICYVISYGMTFLIKWLLAMLVSGKEAFLDAFGQAVYRMSGELPAWMESESFAVRLFGAPIRNLSQIFHMSGQSSYLAVLVILLLVLGVLGSTFYLLRRKDLQKNLSVILLGMALIPVLRFLVMSNHSYVHFFFTYRAYMISVMAICGMWWYNLDLSILAKHKKRKKKTRKS